MANTRRKKKNKASQDDIIKDAAAITGMSEKSVREAFNATWSSILRRIENGEDVQLHGKGEFYLSKRAARVGRNPHTGQEHLVPEREGMAFRPSRAYAKRLRAIREERLGGSMNKTASQPKQQAR